MGKEQFLQQKVLGELDSHMQKHEPGPLSYTQLKINKRIENRPETVKCLKKTGC